MSDLIKPTKTPLHPKLKDFAARLHAIFLGQEENHGGFIVSRAHESGKLEGKGTVLSERVTDKLWQDHLAGRTRLGIIPITLSSRAKWGCVDLDTYPIDHKDLAERIQKAGLPLNVFRSKSGGAHLITILNDFIPAGELQDILKDFCIALKLGRGQSFPEVFPKQRLLSGDGVGNFLNMPYFGAALDHWFPAAGPSLLSRDGKWLSLEDFITQVEIVSPEQLRSHSLKSHGEKLIPDGPLVSRPLHSRDSRRVQGTTAC